MGGWCILTWIDILPWMGVLPWMGHLLWREVRIIRKYSRFNLGKNCFKSHCRTAAELLLR